MFGSHRRAGTGIVFIESRDEAQLLRDVRAESNGRFVAIHYAPSGATYLVNARGMVESEAIAPAGNGALGKALAWASDKQGDRLLIIADAAPVINNAGIWRQLLDALPRLRNAQTGKPALVICAAPIWQLDPGNPLRGLVPMLTQALPTRAALADTLSRITGAPPIDETGHVLDSLAGLSAAVAEQTAAESLVANSLQWIPAHLANARRAALKDAGLLIRPSITEMGGLEPFRQWVASDVGPWARDRQIGVRRIMCAGVNGTGKSYSAQYLAGALGVDCVLASVERWKAGIVGASVANMRRGLSAIDALSKDAPLVVLIDEADKMATEGMDGGTSSGMYAELLAWLDQRDSLALVMVTLNRIDKIDAALDSRFAERWFFDLPSPAERAAIARIHLAAMGAEEVEYTAAGIAEVTEGFSAREIATQLVPTILRQSSRRPNADDVIRAAREMTPTSVTQELQLRAMRSAAAGMRRASAPSTDAGRGGRAIG